MTELFTTGTSFAASILSEPSFFMLRARYGFGLFEIVVMLIVVIIVILRKYYRGNDGNSTGSTSMNQRKETEFTRVDAMSTRIAENSRRKMGLSREKILDAEIKQAEFGAFAAIAAAGYGADLATLAAPKNLNERAERVINMVDPDFDLGFFIKSVNKIYIEFFECIDTQDIERMGTIARDDLCTQYKSQFDELEMLNRNRMCIDPRIFESYICNYRRDYNNEYATVFIDVSLKDYVINKDTFELISGNRDQRVYNRSLVTFMRKRGVRTAIEGIRKAHCPSCGAELDSERTTVCPFCHGIIKAGDAGWVISDIVSLGQGSIQLTKLGIFLEDGTSEGLLFDGQKFIDPNDAERNSKIYYSVPDSAANTYRTGGTVTGSGTYGGSFGSQINGSSGGTLFDDVSSTGFASSDSGTFGGSGFDS